MEQQDFAAVWKVLSASPIRVGFKDCSFAAMYTYESFFLSLTSGQGLTFTFLSTRVGSGRFREGSTELESGSIKQFEVSVGLEYKAK